MKLRLRSHETKETLKVEIPNPCSLLHLRELVSQKFAPPPGSSAIHFSLNRKDVLTTSSPEESVQSMGIASGDLIYFTLNPNGFSTVPQVVPPSAPKSEQSQISHILNPTSDKQDETLNTKSGETLDCNSEEGETSNSDSKAMEIDEETRVGKSFSVPGFLRKVFTEELGDDAGINHKLLGIAVRAVLLESGFVEIDPATKLLKGNKSDVQGNWYLASFYYTLPEIFSSGNLETVKVRFQNLGKYCRVYGCLVNGSGVHSVVVDEDRLVPFLNVVWANCGQVVESMGENNRICSVVPETQVFELWRKMKDGLALPLLIDLCEKADLELPPCFMRLPTELKLKILESLSGVDIAKVSCVCSELRYLASSEDLWKQKYVEKFGGVVGGSDRSFKERYGKAWGSLKRRKTGSFLPFRRVRRPDVGRFPHIIGGDYDMMPRLGPFDLSYGVGLRPNCNLGGSGI